MLTAISRTSVLQWVGEMRFHLPLMASLSPQGSVEVPHLPVSALPAEERGLVARAGTAARGGLGILLAVKQQ